MPHTVGASTHPAHSPAPHGESKGERDRVAIALGRRLGLTPDSARKVLYGDLAYRVVQVLASFDDVREFDRGRRWAAPIHAHFLGLTGEPLSPELEMRFQVADDATGAAHLAWKQEPSPVNRDRLVRALHDQYVTSLAFALALQEEKREQAA